MKGVNEIPKAARVLADRISEIMQKVSSNLIGAFVAGDFSDECDGYWVCVEVEEFIEIPDGMVTLTAPTQRYAVITHRGSNNKIRKTYELLR
ncbi:GyrI-like domain-containing protein [Paenibacillus sp. 1001270B_150601_E10]|uniref:GyrI-like domain-containing protein n=1 Tax=Paenibacillus sp. 1001270B_150601_E10 TaxID=2787079 RepID=UPI00189D862F|nr:GyrI-like domain-containing protein [Paenibacillus sp. 1001270B_150601_E10]